MNNAAKPSETSKILELVQGGGIKLEQLRLAIESGLFPHLLRTTAGQRIDEECFRQTIDLRLPDTFTISVDYDLGLESALKVGGYDWWNPNVREENFRLNLTGQARVCLKLLSFHKPLSWNEAKTELIKKGMRPANMAELLAFGAAYPNHQVEFGIVALGSQCTLENHDGFPFLCFLTRKGRGVGLGWSSRLWYPHTQFAAIQH